MILSTKKESLHCLYEASVNAASKTQQTVPQKKKTKKKKKKTILTDKIEAKHLKKLENPISQYNKAFIMTKWELTRNARMVHY